MKAAFTWIQHLLEGGRKEKLFWVSLARRALYPLSCCWLARVEASWKAAKLMGAENPENRKLQKKKNREEEKRGRGRTVYDWRIT